MNIETIILLGSVIVLSLLAILIDYQAMEAKRKFYEKYTRHEEWDSTSLV